MRKVLSVAACALALVCTSAVSTSADHGGSSVHASTVNAALQQIVDRLAPRGTETLKTTALGVGSGAGSPRLTEPPAQEQDQLAMLLAAVTIMVLIIRRRTGRRD